MTFIQLNEMLISKQRALSLKRNERPEARRMKEAAKIEARRVEAYIKNITRATNPGWTDNHVSDVVAENKEYLTAKADEQIRQCQYDRIDIEIKNLEDELDTVKEMGNNLVRENRVDKNT